MYNATDATPGGTGISWRPANGSFANGLMWNKTLPDIPGSASVYFFDNDMIWARSENNVDENGYLFKTDMGINLKEGHEGEVMWIQNRTGDEGRQGPSVSKGRMGSGYMLEFIVEQMKYFGYSMQTGAKVWETPVIEDAFGQYNSASTGTIIVGDKAYRQSYDGKVRSYDLATGALVWEWYQGDAGLSSVYNSYPYYQDLGGGGGQIVVGNMEHSPGSPLPLNYSLNSIDAETGELTWSLNGAITQAIMADGYIVGINNYDNSLYAIGKGQSATTVASSNPVLTLGESTLLTGTVTDQSPGQTCLGKPAAGTPAIADEDMGAWMAYLYMQQQKPANAKGVEVTISVIDSNNNFYEVGKTTTDTETGLYKLMWEPEIPGTYTVIATFAGSESYWQSLGETAIGVIDAPEHTAAPTAVPESVADMYFVPAIAGIIVAIVIVGAVLALLLLRKRP